MRLSIWALAFSGVATGMVLGPSTHAVAQNAGLPDLAITADSIVACTPTAFRQCPPTVTKSCKRDNALWSGFVTIKNVGFADFVPTAGGGTTGNIAVVQQNAPAGTGPVVQAYVANNANFIDREPLNVALRPLEQTRVELSIGVGQEKHCDTFDIPQRLDRGSAVTRAPQDPFRDSIRGIQRLLNARLPANQRIVEDGLFGRQTAEAVETVFNREVLPIPRAYADDIFDVGVRPGINPQTARFLYQTLDRGNVQNVATTQTPATATTVTESCERVAVSGRPLPVTIIVEVNPQRGPAEFSYANNRKSFVIELDDCS